MIEDLLSTLTVVALGLLLVRPVAGWLARGAAWIETRLAKPSGGAMERMLRLRGVARSDLKPRGKVFVRGELWRAQARHPVAAGEAVEVVDVQGLTLWVRPARHLQSATRQRSALQGSTLQSSKNSQSSQRGG